MRTVAETPIFQRYAAEFWTEVEREQFIDWIAANPEAGDLIRGGGGCRKVRWSTEPGRGIVRIEVDHSRAAALQEGQVRQPSHVVSSRTEARTRRCPLKWTSSKPICWSR